MKQPRVEKGASSSGRLAWAWSPPNYERIESTSNRVTGSLMAPNLPPSGGSVQKMVLAVENFFGSGPTPSSSPEMQAYGATDAALESFGVDFVATLVGPRKVES
jgi:hypothetical protein